MPSTDWIIPAANTVPRNELIEAEVLRDLAELQSRATDNIPALYTQAFLEAASIQQLQELTAAKELESDRAYKREYDRRWRATHPRTEDTRAKDARRAKRYRARKRATVAA